MPHSRHATAKVLLRPSPVILVSELLLKCAEIGTGFNRDTICFCFTFVLVLTIQSACTVRMMVKVGVTDLFASSVFALKISYMKSLAYGAAGLLHRSINERRGDTVI